MENGKSGLRHLIASTGYSLAGLRVAVREAAFRHEVEDGDMGEKSGECNGEMVREFCRYVVVGGVAFLFDFGVLVGIQELLLKTYSWGVYISAVLGFLTGLVVNYFLSLTFVFTAVKDIGKGRGIDGFLMFGFIGLVGLGLTEFSMWLGVGVLDLNYMFIKIVATFVSLLWNYLGRKWIVFG